MDYVALAAGTTIMVLVGLIVMMLCIAYKPWSLATQAGGPSEAVPLSDGGAAGGDGGGGEGGGGGGGGDDGGGDGGDEVIS